MTMRHATVRQLQIFVEAAHSLSFARVAEKLNLTPAAVSFQIKQIEAISGFTLFERMGRRLVLTQAGEALLDYAAIILKALDDADRRFTAMRGLSGGEATIGLVSTAKYIVPHMVARFQADYPGIAIHLMDGNREEILKALVTGRIDIAIMGQPPAGADIDAEAFAPHPSVLVATPSHPLMGRGPVPLSELSGERFVVREDGSGTRALMERHFADAGFSPEIAMSSSSNETIKQAVMAGMGIALISRHTIGLELALGMIAELDVEGLPLMRSWFVAHRANTPLLPVHIQLRSFLLEEGGAIIEEIAEHDRRFARSA